MLYQIILLIIIYQFCKILYKTDVIVLFCDQMLNPQLCSKMADVIAYYWLVADVIATVVRWYRTTFNLCVADVIAIMADGIAMFTIFRLMLLPIYV